MTAVIDSIKGLVWIFRAMGVTLKHFFSRPVTVQYPKEKVLMYPRFRGRHELQRDENGLEKCVACGLCAAICPAECINVEAGENTDEERYSAGERFAREYEINMTRCIFCGYCQEACPTGALVLKHEFALGDYSRPALIYTKERLLQPATPHVIIRQD